MPRSLNPATEMEIAEYPLHSGAQVRARIDAADEAFGSWRSTGWSDRAERLRRMAGLLDEQSADLGRLITAEMGKPFDQSKSELGKCAWACRYFADHAAGFLEVRDVESDESASYVTFEPLGVVLAIMPWNFPFWQFFRFAAPALMAGNGVLLKHAENVWGCAHAIERLALEAGLPGGLVTTLDIESGAVADVIAHDRIRAVTLTGSTRAGRAVASVAGEHLKPCVLELGGSDPYVVLGDADPEAAAEICVQARMINNGQSCIAAKRFIIVESLHEPFRAAVERHLRAYAPGDPMDDGATLGPIAREDLRDVLHRQVRESIVAGAELRMGGEIPDGPGWYYPATLLDKVPAGSPAYDEELFGPAAAILVAADEDEALQIAADTSFGLGAAVFTTDVARGRRIAETRLHAGCCAVNTLVKSDPRLPFGGIRDSGYGRELGALGILEFVNVKSVVVG